MVKKNFIKVGMCCVRTPDQIYAERDHLSTDEIYGEDSTPYD